MKILIVYGTKHGFTEKCITMLSEKLNEEVDLCNLKRGQTPILNHYEKIIIGGSVYMGKIQKEVSEYCLRNLNELKEKKVGLFVCCMSEGDTAKATLNNCFPQELLSSAIVKEHFGGAFTFKDMNFFERFIVKKVSKVDKDMTNILEENIVRFAETMSNA